MPSHQVRNRPTKYWTPYTKLLVLFTRHRCLFAILLICSFGAAFTETLGVGAILSIAQDPTKSSGWLSQIPIGKPFGDFLRTADMIDRFRLVALVLVIFMMGRSLLLYSMRRCAVRLQVDIVKRLQQKIFRKLHQVDLRFIENNDHEGLVILFGAFSVQSARLITSISGGIASIAVIIVYLLLLFFLSWKMTVLAIGLSILVASIVVIFFGAKLSENGVNHKALMKSVRSKGSENLAGMKVIRLFSQEANSIHQLDRLLDEYHQKAENGQNLVYLSKLAFAMLMVFALSTIIYVGTYLTATGGNELVSEITLFVVVTFRLLPTASSLSETHAAVTRLHPALDSILQFLELNAPGMRIGTLPIAEVRNSIKFEDVNFRYNDQGPLILKNFNLELTVGRVSAIVGPSGSGKSTVVDLLARLYDCSSGHIWIDGKDLAEIRIEHWHRCVSVVNQDTFLFNESVLNNIRYGNPFATLSDVEAVAKIAQASSFIEHLSESYETGLGDRGVLLSGGQRQRIAIARALLTHPQILILDESTSELDAETEQKLLHAIVNSKIAKTLIVVAHRLSTVRNADQILVMDQGEVIESGKHQILMQTKGLYWRLNQESHLIN